MDKIYDEFTVHVREEYIMLLYSKIFNNFLLSFL